MATVTLHTQPAYFGLNITKDASYTSNGHAVHIMCDKMGEMWDMFPLRHSFHPSNFGANTIQVITNTMRFPTEHP